MTDTSHDKIKTITIWLFNIAIENCPLFDDVPMKPSTYKGLSMAE